MTEHFSTHLLDRVIAKKREKREQVRRDRLSACFKALDKLSCLISFEEAYIFGSLAKPYRFYRDSDADVAFIGLSNKDFFQAIAFLSRELSTDVDVVQLEKHFLKELIIREGIRWKRRD